MKNFKTKIESSDDNIEYNFVCHENDEQINIGDKYLFFFGDMVDVGVCQTETEKQEVNKHNREYQKDKIDLVHNFWTKCYKIKETNFKLSLVHD